MAKKISIEEIVGWWLERYHGITYQEAKEEYEAAKEKGGEPVFFEKYKVTQEQHDEWRAWFEKYLIKKSGLGEMAVKRGSWGIYLDTAPMVKDNEI